MKVIAIKISSKDIIIGNPKEKIYYEPTEQNAVK
jgi:hypothetical protein